MQLEILKGKEIQFIQSIDIFLRTINNNQQIQVLLDCFNIKSKDFDSAYELIERIDYQVISNAFERLHTKRNITTNNAGEKYLVFSTDNFYTFLNSSQGIQLITIYVLWNTLSLNSEANKVNSEAQVAYVFYMLMNEFEAYKTDILNNHFNTLTFKSSLLESFPLSILSFTAHTHSYYTNFNTKLTPIDISLYQYILSPHLTLYTINNGLVYRIVNNESGYDIFFTELTHKIENTNIEKLDFSTGLVIPYEYETIEEIELVYVKTESILVDNIQKQFNKYSNLLNLNPTSKEVNTKKKAINTFIAIIHSIVECTLAKNKAKAHVIQTITGLIAYDFNILKLDTELSPNDNSKADNDIIRKRVKNSLESNNKLKLMC